MSKPVKGESLEIRRRYVPEPAREVAALRAVLTVWDARPRRVAEQVREWQKPLAGGGDTHAVGPARR